MKDARQSRNGAAAAGEGPAPAFWSAEFDPNEGLPAGFGFSAPWLADYAGWSDAEAWDSPPPASAPAACVSAPTASPNASGAISPPTAGTGAASPEAVTGTAITHGTTPFGGLGGAFNDVVGTTGSSALLADQLRSDFGVTGAGIKIGVLSDSFGLHGTMAGVTVLEDGQIGNDEGRAMLELAHQIAPGAQLFFHTADASGQGTVADETDFANGIRALAADGCNVIIDDVGYFDEPIFQEGAISQAIDSAVAGGALYFTAAGNDASNAYQAAWSSVTPQTVTLDAHTQITFDLQWSEPTSGFASSLGLEFKDAFGDDITATQESGVDFNGRPVTLLELVNSGSNNVTGTLTISDLSGPAPGLVKLIALGDGQPVGLNGANTGTVFGHAEDPNAIAVAAANAANDSFESFSSSGAGSEWLFDANGNQLSSPIVPGKVDLTSVDGIATDIFDPFFGTSAAAPTAGAVAALLMQMAPGATGTQIKQALETTATSLSQPSSLQGAGLINALAAGEAFVPTTSIDVAQQQFVKPDQRFDLSTLFAASVIGQISQYQVYETSATTPVGTLADANGNPLPALQNNAVSSLSGITYTSSENAGADELFVRAEAYGRWGNWNFVQFNNSGNLPPSVTTLLASDTLRPNASVAVQQVFSVSDPDGDAIAQYQVYLADAATGGQASGSLSQNNGAIASGVNVTVTSLSGLIYTGGLVPGSDALWIRASDGLAWSGWSMALMNDPGDPPPVTRALISGDTVASGAAIALSQLFSASDPDGAPIAQYQVYLANAATGGQPSGALSQNGTGIASLQNVTVASLSDLIYTGGAAAGNDVLWMRANDGTSWGNWSMVQLTDAGNAPPVMSSLMGADMIGSGQTVALTQLFSANDPDGDRVARYQVYLADAATGGQPSGALSQNGTAIASLQDVTVTSLGGLTYTGGSAAGTDVLWMRANDGTSWGNWTMVQIKDSGATAGGTVSPAAASSSSASPQVSAEASVAQLVQGLAAFSAPGVAISPPVLALADPPPALLGVQPHH